MVGNSCIDDYDGVMYRDSDGNNDCDEVGDGGGHGDE